MINELSIDYRLRLGKNFALVGGPSFNVYVTNEKIGDEYGTIDIPKTVYEYEWTNTKLFSWFGWKLGFSYSI